MHSRFIFFLTIHLRNRFVVFFWGGKGREGQGERGGEFVPL